MGSGALLQARRQKLGLTSKEVAERLNIRHKYVVAIEENLLDVLPNGVYTTGYIKLYSQLLGIQVEAPAVNKALPLKVKPFLPQLKRYRKPLSLVSFLLLILVVFLYYQ